MNEITRILAGPVPVEIKSTYKILIPTDFDEQSRRAVGNVLQTLSHNLTHLVLLYAHRERLAEGAPMIALSDILRQKAERLLQTERDYYSTVPYLEHVNIMHLHRLDGYFQSICDVAAAEDVDLIILTSESYRAPRFGSTEDDPNYLLHKLSRPLMLVPKLLN